MLILLMMELLFIIKSNSITNKKKLWQISFHKIRQYMKEYKRGKASCMESGGSFAIAAEISSNVNNILFHNSQFSTSCVNINNFDVCIIRRNINLSK